MKMTYTIEQLKDYLKRHDIKPSTIRIKVLEYLLNNRIHPTADDIYQYLISEIPTLSKTSIYNTLELFMEKGVVNALSLKEKELRYDINTYFHGHFKCEICGNVYDFPVSEEIINVEELKGFVIRNVDINVYGICKKCNEKNKEV
ncbi:MAG: Ferric uptake regulator, Fur family [Caldanaerobacter subterraneus]|jgi:Fur family peroxide stress response transcriptional regulator|uniref:Ferric uptake regulator, Fur family n=2 Tax=Thermoanaerobacter TaxID=1754 RepID=B0KDB2_THEP3|nr:ferric uptake regulator, Fur family [Thermoanaerobacter sp. X514]ABY95631.1 ferric uptake regulator, Fur family [Thermoanaerobacter pseudethanolicus ATCC 33223]ADV80569.1 ferric-uptake regulator [Thermoanaerobacter brockii subsp. finnii Ako-1]KUJ90489.1 MAG: Fur family ferric uptake regulator [Thermoanaerobacter thermocopriae]KUK35342.1 MAG: Ferric uptake regulator, Fur family [Caldanaerobacter subterraneus]MBZ4655595.1 ferric-uptake regulator [Thermoanaerobacter sp.]